MTNTRKRYAHRFTRTIAYFAHFATFGSILAVIAHRHGGFDGAIELLKSGHTLGLNTTIAMLVAAAIVYGSAFVLIWLVATARAHHYDRDCGKD